MHGPTWIFWANLTPFWLQCSARGEGVDGSTVVAGVATAFTVDVRDRFLNAITDASVEVEFMPKMAWRVDGEDFACSGNDVNCILLTKAMAYPFSPRPRPWPTCEEHKPCDRNADDARGIPNCWAMSEGRLSTCHAAVCSAADDVCCCLLRVSRTRLASSRRARRRRRGRPPRHVHAPRPERLQVRCRGPRTLVTLGGC